MKNLIISLTIITALAFSSCDDFLDKTPYNSVTRNTAITSVKDCQVALNGLYTHFKSTSYYGKNMTVVPDLATDEILAIIGYSNTYGIMYQWTYNASTEEVVNAWAIMYALTANASFLLEEIDKVQGDEATLNNIKGQAYLARAIAHFDLVRLYAKTYNASTAATDLGVPVVTKFEIATPPRKTVAEVYTQIIADAEQALNLITTDQADNVYFTKGAANAFLARVYLTMKDWDNAIKYSTAVINNSKYALCAIDKLSDMFLNDRGNEIIWKVGLTADDASGRQPGYPYYNDSQGKPNPDYMPADKFLDMYDQDADARFFTYFNAVQTRYGWTGYLVTKYPTNPAFAATTNANGSNMAKVFRLAEQYLIRAEAYSEKGGASDADALADLNTLRSKRIEGYTAQTNLTGNALKNAIWEERMKELAYEGQYWFDLKRKGLGFQRATQENAVPGINFDQLKVEPNNYRWQWPIPQSELDANPSIPENNPGY